MDHGSLKFEFISCFSSPLASVLPLAPEVSASDRRSHAARKSKQGQNNLMKRKSKSLQLAVFVLHPSTPFMLLNVVIVLLVPTTVFPNGAEKVPKIKNRFQLSE